MYFTLAFEVFAEVASTPSAFDFRHKIATSRRSQGVQPCDVGVVHKIKFDGLVLVNFPGVSELCARVCLLPTLLTPASATDLPASSIVRLGAKSLRTREHPQPDHGRHLKGVALKRIYFHCVFFLF